MSLTITTVDAFTDKPFRGNPAAVTVLPEPRPDQWMQSVAAEMNLAETAYLLKRDDGSFDLRWFTPTVEVDLCGHATIAAAHVLWSTGALPESEIARFHTKSGELTATKRGEWIELNFPSTPVAESPEPPVLSEALGVSPIFIGKSKFDYLVEIAEEQLSACEPDLFTLSKIDTRGVIITSRSKEPAYHFKSRFFAPASGINEDPVTGSAHCALAPYWSAKLGKTTMMAYQASKRGGKVKVELQGDRVLISGQAVTVLNATLAV